MVVLTIHRRAFPRDAVSYADTVKFGLCGAAPAYFYYQHDFLVSGIFAVEVLWDAVDEFF